MDNRSVEGTANPEGRTAQGLAENTLYCGKIRGTDCHHFAVTQGIANAREENQGQCDQGATHLHAIQMGNLEQEDTKQNHEGEQQIFYRDSSAEQGR